MECHLARTRDSAKMDLNAIPEAERQRMLRHLEDKQVIVLFKIRQSNSWAFMPWS